MKIKNLIPVLLAAIALNGCEMVSDSEMHEIIETGDESVMEISVTGISEIEETTLLTEAENPSDLKNSIYVYVCGEVVNPGVYELPIGSRAFEALDAAGGATENAAAYLVNLAETVKDEQKLYIPAIGEDYTCESDAPQTGNEGIPSKININTATRDQLMTLSGVGGAKADAIIDYREQMGGFTSIEQIMEVNGIKEAAFARIKDKITVD